MAAGSPSSNTRRMAAASVSVTVNMRRAWAFAGATGKPSPWRGTRRGQPSSPGELGAGAEFARQANRVRAHLHGEGGEPPRLDGEDVYQEFVSLFYLAEGPDP